jgi:hypothetical protein
MVPSNLRGRLRLLAWSTPVLAAWQSGCIVGSSSCDDFEPERVRLNVPFEVADSGASNGGPPTTAEECVEFCQQHGAFGNDITCSTATADAGLVVVCEFTTVCEGRRPDGYQPPSDDAGSPLLGRYFARMAASEAASVSAFQQMAEELAEHAAPLDLIEGAQRAAAEEERHFRIAAALAKLYGAEPARGVVAPRRRRPLLELAVENAREGVVRETLGAAVGFWQAAHAEEQAVRSAMRRIAADEAGHALLSWRLDAWAREGLSAAERARVDLARDAALATLVRDADAGVAVELVRRAGLPPPAVAGALLATAREQLFS